MSIAPADLRSRQNNLTLIRTIAALAVMVSHAWPLVHGPGTREPLEWSGYSLGTIAVLIFFGLSGYLIAASWLRDPHPGRFLVRRARRLLPALWVMLVLCVFVMGPLIGTLDPGAYFSDRGTWTFLVRNSALLPVAPTLPGVFQSNPYPAAAGSIWSLHYEALCYLALLLVGLTRGLAGRRAVLWLGIVIAMSIVAALPGIDMPARLDTLVLVGLPFALGAAAWIWRDRITLGWPGNIALLAAAILTSGTPLAHLGFSALVVYATLWLGFVPSQIGPIAERAGDCSYGIYLYAFPVQGLVQHLFAPTDVATHLAWAVPMTLALAGLSWIAVERPWLTRRRFSVRRTLPNWMAARSDP